MMRVGLSDLCINPIVLLSARTISLCACETNVVLFYWLLWGSSENVALGNGRPKGRMKEKGCERVQAYDDLPLRTLDDKINGIDSRILQTAIPLLEDPGDRPLPI